MTAPIDVTGQRFGHLVAVERAGKDRCGSWMWLCRCDCGAEVVIGISRLRAANTIGCRLCAARRSRKNRYAQMIEDLEWIIGTDSPDNVARRLGYTARLARAHRARRLHGLHMDGRRPLAAASRRPGGRRAATDRGRLAARGLGSSARAQDRRPPDRRPRRERRLMTNVEQIGPRLQAVLDAGVLGIEA